MAADLWVQGPVLLDGSLDARAADATVALVPPAGDGDVAAVEAAEGALRVVTARRDVVVNPTGGEHWLRPEYDVQTVPLGAARIVVRAADADFLGLAAPAEGGALVAHLDAAPRVLGIEAQERAFAIGTEEPYPYYFERVVPAWSFELLNEGGRGRFDAPAGLQLAVIGATLEVHGGDGVRTFELGNSMEPAQGGTGAAPLYRKVTSFAILVLERATLAVAPDAGAVYYSRSPVLDLDGRLVLQRATGLLTAPGAAAQAQAEALVFEGRFTLDDLRAGSAAAPLGASRSETHLRVEGAAGQVLIGGQPWALPPDAAELALPAVALLGAVVAWLTGLGPKVLAAAATPAFAAATPEAMLANQRRRSIYEVVLRTPGVHMRELHRLTGMRWGSLQYHTAVLVGTGLLVATRAGRRTVLACDAHRLTPEQVRALHLLRSPRALRVARAVASGQARTQRDVALATGVSFRLVSRYLGVMQHLGLVENVNGNRPKRYASTPRLAELLPHAVPEPAPMMAPSATEPSAWPPAGH